MFNVNFNKTFTRKYVQIVDISLSLSMIIKIIKKIKIIYFQKLNLKKFKEFWVI